MKSLHNEVCGAGASEVSGARVSEDSGAGARASEVSGAGHFLQITVTKRLIIVIFTVIYW